MTLEEIKKREKKCYQENRCFISLHPLGKDKELGTMIWNDTLDDSVFVLKQYSNDFNLENVRKKMAEKMQEGMNKFHMNFGLKDEEVKNFLERTLHTTLDK